MVTQVVTNLLDNAARYRASRTRVSATIEDRHLVLGVEDDGPGIPPADRERVFERFTRLDDARVAGEGTGLGLAIANELVGAAGGTMSIHTGDLGGAAFVVRLPA